MTRPPRSPDDPLQRLRAICLALPEALEKVTWGEPTFRVHEKIFAMFTHDESDDGHVALWCKASEGLQDILVSAAPQRFFVPPYVGRYGWIGLRLDGAVDWRAVADFVNDSYQMTAPKRLVASPGLTRRRE